ncbi:MAG: hypothetical protein HONBIEJF_03027 [Fimbriimonadaceae bacterium]|nr:hypothetical protein [Fimbriimonadaceae bacterium]
MIISFTIAAVLAQEATSTALTVYNEGYALVRETRNVNLRQGRQQIAIEDVAQMIDASSVSIASVSDPGSFSVWEQNYQYDLISPQAILAKAVGKEIVFNQVLPNGAQERIVGTLLSSPTAVINTGQGPQHQWNGMVIRTRDGRILLNPTGMIEVSSIPEGLISKPTLLWDLMAEKGGTNTIELSYLTTGMGWRANYVISLDADGKKGDVQGWVTLTNNSGTTFKDAKLKLLAGEVFRRQAGGGFGGGAGGMRDAMAKAESNAFAEEQLGDYHLYTLQRPATTRNNEMKQLSLLEASRVPVTKKLIFDPLRNFRGYRPSEGEVGTGPLKPLIRIEFKNDKASQMGMPLPKGSFKVLQRDSGGSAQFLGEDIIDHTPKDETVSLEVGRAFDVVAERKRTSFKWYRVGSDIRGADESFSVEFRNRKETAERVHYWDRFWWEFKVVNSNMPFTSLESETVQWVIDLKPNEVKTLTFDVQHRW